MKTKLSVLVLAMCSMLAFTSCDDDDNNYVPNQTITKAFDTKYPNAGRVEWESKAGYEVAEFHVSGNETEAWFDKDGNWLLTKTEIDYGQLPQDIRTAIAQSIYKDWKTTDYDKLEHPNAATVYVVEAELGEQEVDLYFTEDGVLIKVVNDNDINDDFKPIVIPESITELIDKMYPGATILEIDNEHNGIEVDIRHNNIHKEVFFNSSNEWIYTEWDIFEADVPAIVMNALKASDYKNYRIDDIDFIENPTKTYYVFELEQGNDEVKMTISAEGVIEGVIKD